jgi:DNA polymerase II small subunit/DNA polymerase delta subunit B
MDTDISTAIINEVIAVMVIGVYGASAVVDRAHRIFAIPCKNGKVRCVVSQSQDTGKWESLEVLPDQSFGVCIGHGDDIHELFSVFDSHTASDAAVINQSG